MTSARRVAVLDLGTNTLILLIAEIRGKNFTVLHDEARVVRLGEGIQHNQYFLPQAMDRAVRTLRDFKTIIEHFNCESVRAVGTAGFRNAHNADEFIHRVRDETGIEIKVITGDTEADLIFAAAQADFPDLPRPLLVLDIGGGSTEFIFATDDGSKSATSLPFGSVKLTEKFIATDPPTTDEIQNLVVAIQKQLSELNKNPRPAALVATAGTATTLQALALGLLHYDPAQVHGSILKTERLKELILKLEALTFDERKVLPCLEPKRADVIVAGARILLTVCEYFGMVEIHISDRGLRYGVLRELL